MKLIRFLLFPFAILYDIVTTIRNVLYDRGIFKSTKFDIPVIAVGNLNVGGTGKTPQIEYLIELLKSKVNLAVLSRGYKRKTKGFQIVNETHTALDVGDEPLQFYTKYKDDVIVSVDANRVNGIQNLLKQQNAPEVILLDDAFQHRKVQASFYVLLTKYNDLYTNDFLLPTGNLRENRKGANRADVIVITKCPSDISKEEREKILKSLKTNKPVFFSTIVYDEVVKGAEVIPLESIKNKEVVLVTGIANPNPLLEFLATRNIKFTHLDFPDHHNFSEKEINSIKEKVEGDKLLLTTEKDYMRLKNSINSLYYLGIKSQIIDDVEAFNSLILKAINI
ncbi:tetraacyldisaccharide 4'-kinase [Tenacibaculum holothuriorum]|uniref:Tetraacyldisaccharide 4'-kinase n=1 Tax=Tenacibaculum holothuriorum TaxID=1635173 RepID=A0A1Y2PE65_9FLAO|nr:tetraacyldisaccharide 4'-kinase [Tenacibaculum holothuriorum]OSY87968.1 tetraacyldisaccharide 4'-kinase [Tenacibaculum holothuriorum]